MRQPDHDYHETTRDRDDRLIDPTCAYCGKPKHLCDGGAKQTDDLETFGKLKRSELDALLARVEQGARAAERDKIVAWLRTAPCDSPGHDPRWCQDCQVRERAADAIDCGVHRK